MYQVGDSVICDGHGAAAQEIKFYLSSTGKQVLLDMSASHMEHGGEELIPLQPNRADASTRCHMPSVQYNNGCLYIHVGEEPHPMTEEHHIQWIYIHTALGGQFRVLHPFSPAEVELPVCDDRVYGVYAYCNRHGLWRLDGSKVMVFPDIARPGNQRQLSPTGRSAN